VLYTDHYELTKNISRGGGISDKLFWSSKRKTKLFSLKRNVAIVGTRTK